MTICEPLTSVQGSICLAWTEPPANFCPLDLLPSCTGLPCSYLSNEGLISRFKSDSLLTESGPYVWFGLVFSLLKFETLLSMFKKLGDFPKIPDF